MFILTHNYKQHKMAHASKIHSMCVFILHIYIRNNVKIYMMKGGKIMR